MPGSRVAAIVAAGLVMVAGMLSWGQGPTAVGQDPVGIDVRGADFERPGETRVTVDLAGVDGSSVDGSAFTIDEDGEAVGPVTVVAVAQASDPPARSVMLAMDTSNSTTGPPRNQSIAAAKAFASQVVPDDVAVGVVAFNRLAEVVIEPTTDVAAIEQALDNLPTGNATTLYDGVVKSAESLVDRPGQASIVVFSDGADSRSVATLQDASASAILAGASITSVALTTADLDLEALELLADDTGGRVLEVSRARDLADAFEQVASDLTSQYVLSYPSTARSGQMTIEVTIDVDGGVAMDSIPVLKPVASGSVEPAEPNVVAVTSPGPLGGSAAGLLAVVLTGVGVALLLLALFVPVSDRQVARNLQAAIGGDAADVVVSDELSPTTAAMSRRAVQLVERVPKPEGYDGALQHRIDQAAWPFRVSEFTAVRAIMALVAFGLVWALSTLVLAFLAAAVGWVVPNVLLGIRLRQRQQAFMAQLPDTLQLLSGSLKAGYGVLQAIDTVVKETEEPTRSEFQRVLSEARLGLELDDSLLDMADRVGTDDFRWVAVSISIQRRVGGNLAQLLETVAATLRERAATRRQIQALSAEGRLSAVILVALPFALAAYMLVVNPSYLAVLFTTGFGQAMVAGSAILMVIGIFWMRNLIEIDV